MQQRKKSKSSKRQYRKPVLERRCRLADVTEARALQVTGAVV